MSAKKAISAERNDDAGKNTAEGCRDSAEDSGNFEPDKTGGVNRQRPRRHLGENHMLTALNALGVMPKEDLLNLMV